MTENLEEYTNNCKNIIITPIKKGKNSKVIQEYKKITKPRVITQSKNWNIPSEYYDPMLQWNCIFNNIVDIPTETLPTELSGRELIVQDQSKRQIAIKISGYRAQDVKNNLFNSIKFVNLEFVMNLLKESNMKCFYCKEMVQVLYENVREPRQWTLDRIENNQGHNTSNVMIACLQCNLRRRCMYHERYLFTKQLKIVRNDSV
jgi:hypothetical protein